MFRRNLLASSSLLLAIALFATPYGSSEARGDFVTGGALTLNLDGNALANDADVPALNALLQKYYGTSYNTSQTFLEFGRYISSSEIVGLSTNDLRPLPISQVASFANLRSGWVRPSSTGLVFNINGSNPAVGQATNFSYDPTNVTGTATGSIGTSGAVSFWYGNDPIIATGSIWNAFGDFTLQYSAARAVNGDSGWYISNALVATEIMFDTQDVVVTTTPGGLSVSGNLVISPEFSSFIFGGLDAGLAVGSFSLNGQSVVPEPSSLVMLGLGTVCAGAFQLRRRVKGKSFRSGYRHSVGQSE
jgi:hypothetical protein